MSTFGRPATVAERIALRVGSALVAWGERSATGVSGATPALPGDGSRDAGNRHRQERAAAERAHADLLRACRAGCWH